MTRQHRYKIVPGPNAPLAERIVRLMKERNLSERKLCKDADLKEDAIRSIRLGRKPRVETVQAIADYFGVDLKELLGGETTNDETTMSTGHMVSIDELDVRAGAGGNDAVVSMLDSDGGDYVERIALRSRWTVPIEMAWPATRATPNRLKIISVIGNSMVPDFRPGQNVLVDTTDRVPSPPGVFVLWDGLALVVKLVEYIPHSDPAIVRIMSKNPDFQTYERLIDEAYIQGRVVGSWQWT